jgi:hypothetical protein
MLFKLLQSLAEILNGNSLLRMSGSLTSLNILALILGSNALMAHRLAFVALYLLALAPKTLATLSAERYHLSSQSLKSTYGKLHFDRSIRMSLRLKVKMLDTC